MYDKVGCFNITSLQARHRYGSLFWLSEVNSVISRQKKERCCDEKQCLVRCAEKILDREREGRRKGEGEPERQGDRESCCEVKWLLDMWGVPTYDNEKVPCTITITLVCAKLGQLMKSSKGKKKRQKADIISSISFFQKEKQDIVKLHSIACSHLVRRGKCNVANFCTYAICLKAGHTDTQLTPCSASDG